MRRSDALRAATSGQNTDAEPASLMNSKKPLKPIPASTASPNPLLEPPLAPRCMLISQMLTRASANPASCNTCGAPSVHRLKSSGRMAVMTEARGALRPILPMASAL